MKAAALFRDHVMQILTCLQRYCPAYTHFVVAKLYLQTLADEDWVDIVSEFHKTVHASPEIQRAIVDHDALAILELGVLELVLEGDDALATGEDLRQIWSSLSDRRRQILFHHVEQMIASAP